MYKDNFWKIFWASIVTVVLVYASAIVWLRLLYLRAQDDPTLASAVGVTYDPSRDPFQYQDKRNLRTDEQMSHASDYLFRESLPLGFEDWSWGTKTNWRSNDKAMEGSFSLHAQFLEPWSGIRLNAQPFDVSLFQSLSLAVFPSEKTSDLFLELFDKYGNSLGKQSLGWYSPKSSLTPNEWNVITIPLANLMPYLSYAKEITGFAISVGPNAGSAYVDAIRLEKKLVVYPRWEEPAPVGETWSQDIFALIRPLNLPYSLAKDLDKFDNWRTLFGNFAKTDLGVLIGPIEKKTTGSMSVFGGGKNWKDYRVNATVYWGMTSTFSILMRFIDDGNFVACAYSHYGTLVQIYDVTKGESKLISQSPLLAIKKYEPWKDAQHGADVQRNRLSCYMDGEKVLSATLPDMQPNGTVGVETWSLNSDDYPHTLKEIMVSPLE